MMGVRYAKYQRYITLVCRKCGRLADILLEDLTEKLQSQLGIQMLSYDLKINYICEECLEKENGK